MILRDPGGLVARLCPNLVEVRFFEPETIHRIVPVKKRKKLQQTLVGVLLLPIQETPKSQEVLHRRTLALKALKNGLKGA